MGICLRCAGSGKIMGGGMLTEECYQCNGEGQVDSKMPPKKTQIDKRSRSYRTAINDLMKRDSKISRKQAEELFEEEYKRLDEIME